MLAVLSSNSSFIHRYGSKMFDFIDIFSKLEFRNQSEHCAAKRTRTCP